MSLNNKVAWSEGMFIRPQHFQQQDRYFEYLTKAIFDAVQSYGWGFHHYKIDRSHLAIGKIALENCQGIFPDGIPFDCPSEHYLPSPLSIPEGCHHKIFYLALPLRSAGATEIEATKDGERGSPLSRYAIKDASVIDNTSFSSDAVSIGLACLRPQLLLETENTDRFSLLPLGRVMERLADGKVILDEDFVPPCLSCHASAKLSGFISEAIALLQQRGQTLSKRIGDINRSAGVNAIADFLLLQLIHRTLPALKHLSEKSLVHPEDFYLALIKLVGALNTFQRNEKQKMNFLSYRHDMLQETFYPLMQQLRESLLQVIDPVAQMIPLEAQNFGISVGAVNDKSLFENSTFVLAVKPDVPTEVLLNHFATQIKIGPPDQMHQLINLQLPGIALRALPSSPIQIPFNAQFSYFELVQQGDLWNQVKDSSGIALHSSGELSTLKFELWAIRG